MRSLFPAAMLIATAATASSLALHPWTALSEPFNIKLDRFGSGFDGQLVQAANAGFHVGLPSQATQNCNINSAVFVIRDGELFLKTPASITQKAYTDFTYPGDGLLAYQSLPGSYDLSPSAVTKGWNVNTLGKLKIDIHEFLVCPNSRQAGVWDLFLQAGLQNPPGYNLCELASGYVVTVPASGAPDCTYSFVPVS